MEERISAFSSSLKKLSCDSQNRISKLTYTLFLVEQSSPCPVLKKKCPKLKDRGLQKNKG